MKITIENIAIEDINESMSDIQIRAIYKDSNAGNFDKREKLNSTISDERRIPICTKVLAAERRLFEYTHSRLFLDKVRPFANQSIGSDMRPFEVVRVVSATCVEVREMDAKQITFPKEFHVGGFAAHCADNYNQEYEYSSNIENPIQKIRLSKKGWGLGRFHMSNEPRNFYDYNF